MSWTHDRVIHESAAPDRKPIHSFAYLLAGSLFVAFLALYVRTAAPSVLSGDSAEFQLAAPLLGVPHPTTYPLYVLLGKLATLLIPFGDLAWRVTLVSAGSAALAVALFFLLARAVVGSTPAAVGALALGLAPGLWNAATIAEVYALLAALLAGLAYLIATGAQLGGAAEIEHEPIGWRMRLAAFVGGLGFTHHGLFVIVGLPLLAAYLLWLLFRRSAPNRTPALQLAVRPFISRNTAKQVALLALCFAAGLLPWLYPLAQYARYGPFAGADYGLPRHYYWGAPESWEQTLGLLSGGPLRQGVFRVPSLDAIAALLSMVGQRLLFEFGPLGVPLGLLGSLALLRKARMAWIGAAWVFFSTLAYLLLLGPAVQDAPVFTLPMLLPWALWIAAGVESILQKTADDGRRTMDDGRRKNRHVQQSRALSSSVARPERSRRVRLSSLVLLLLVAATLAWGYTRLPFSSKRQLWLFRRFGEATLARLPPNAVVITHWEQGMTLQYLILAERQRPDVWVDVVEPGDVAWGARARRYANRAVFFVGTPSDVAGLPVDLTREDDYVDVFMLRK